MPDINTYIYEHTGTGGLITLIALFTISMWTIYDVWYEMAGLMRRHKAELRRSTRIVVHMTFLLTVLSLGHIMAERIMFLVKL